MYDYNTLRLAALAMLEQKIRANAASKIVFEIKNKLVAKRKALEMIEVYKAKIQKMFILFQLLFF
jgi:hypothetical protein